MSRSIWMVVAILLLAPATAQLNPSTLVLNKPIYTQVDDLTFDVPVPYTAACSIPCVPANGLVVIEGPAEFESTTWNTTHFFNPSQETFAGEAPITVTLPPDTPTEIIFGLQFQGRMSWPDDQTGTMPESTGVNYVEVRRPFDGWVEATNHGENSYTIKNPSNSTLQFFNDPIEHAYGTMADLKAGESVDIVAGGPTIRYHSLKDYTAGGQITLPNFDESIAVEMTRGPPSGVQSTNEESTPLPVLVVFAAIAIAFARRQ